MSERILIIEDDNDLSEFMCWQLQREGYQVQVSKQAIEGLAQLREWRPNLIILDIMMPDMTGWDACQRIREFSDVPIIFTTALGTEKDVVRGLDLGADDYLVKPFGIKELNSRIRAVLRRQKPDEAHDHIYTNGKLWVNQDTHQVRVNDQPVELTPIEFKLLACLIEHEGKVVTHHYLLTHGWGQEHEAERHYLKLYIWYLRQKLEADPTHPRMILTQRGVGYRLVRVSEPDEQ
jgi:DNA-binding response OmpR family regulator